MRQLSRIVHSIPQKQSYPCDTSVEKIYDDFSILSQKHIYSKDRLLGAFDEISCDTKIILPNFRERCRYSRVLLSKQILIVSDIYFFILDDKGIAELERTGSLHSLMVAIDTSGLENSMFFPYIGAEPHFFDHDMFVAYTYEHRLYVCETKSTFKLCYSKENIDMSTCINVFEDKICIGHEYGYITVFKPNDI